MSAAAAGETAIVGAGAIGLALGFEVARRGGRVRVLERDRAGAGATWAAGGMLAPIAESETEPPQLIALARDSLARYPEFVAAVQRASGRDCRYRCEGTLWVAAGRDDREEMEHLASKLEHKGLPFERLSAEQTLRLEPRLSGRVAGALLLAGDHQVDPRALTPALAQALLASGGTIELGVDVRRVEPSGSGWRLLCEDRDGRRIERRAQQVVIAAGAWSGRGLHPAVERLPLRPVKGQLVRLRGAPLLARVVRGADVYLIPRADGELLLGATTEELGFDETPTAGAVLELLRQAWRLLPGIDELEFREVSVGLRSAVDDPLPVIGRAAAGGLFVAFAHYRNGILLAPATAHHLAREILNETEVPELEPFRPRRLQAAAERRGAAGRGARGWSES